MQLAPTVAAGRLQVPVVRLTRGDRAPSCSRAVVAVVAVIPLVSGVALGTLGVGWHTVMRALRDYGRPLVDDPRRIAGVAGRCG